MVRASRILIKAERASPRTDLRPHVTLMGQVSSLSLRHSTMSVLGSVSRTISPTRKHFDVVQPNWAKRAVQYGRFFQGWSMFAPDPPKRDGHLVMDVELPDGTHIDPQTGIAPLMAAANFELMDWDQMWGELAPSGSPPNATPAIAQSSPNGCATPISVV